MSDLSIFYFFNNFAFRSHALDALILFFAVFLGYWIVAGVVACAAATILPRYSRFRRKNIEIAIVSLASALIARFGVTELIRFFYSRPRPFEALADANQLLFREGGGSFPSGHAAFSFALAAVVTFHYPRVGMLFFASAILISFTRIAAGVHWPSDILGGAAIGIVSGFAVLYFSKRFVSHSVI
ncbi:MAG: hypothetical protein A2847_03095 [Candidatus Sungbacteria bacterium RIFCSPHIGHO2_01_FULL_50_25]|uniref:Phosphatidic acid phosphatase type 2/haloperoxidase domain-containing protein n=1 Tax=Candidatus Sungbacteria bacterium RIFCSPHIGHO2_01_FULL_50_25 TaxID=1802265 RepID=A0A1G2K9W9_9BACT|nr:MAG: hypothetical protein A2847_03095 [Candidatus Sungbacteria bacterium RIFCSPHIGHO2_01_FULL_50_25]